VLRTLIALPPAAALSFLCAVAGIGAGIVDRSGRWAHRIARLWGRGVLAMLGVRTSVSGLEHVPAGPAVYAANHSSMLDIPIAFAALPFDFRFVHKRSLHLLPFVGWYLFVAGHVAIDRARPFRAHKSLEAAVRRIRGGASLAVFPEGTRGQGRTLQRFKRGGVVLALGAGVPLVPVSLDGVRRVIPHGIFSLRSGQVRVQVHPAMSIQGRDSADAGDLAERLREIVAGGLRG
jgi:1-acyl-sn-glycerol-3-phosphate acyltransferase